MPERVRASASGYIVAVQNSVQSHASDLHRIGSVICPILRRCAGDGQRGRGDGDFAYYIETFATLTATGATVASKTYDGNTAASVSSVTFTGLVPGEALALGTDYTATVVVAVVLDNV